MSFKGVRSPAASPAASLLSYHPLQRLRSPSRQMSLMLHVVGLISFTLSYKYLFDWPNIYAESWGWNYQFLTIIGLTIALLTFVFGLIADLTLSPNVFLIKNYLTICSAPLEVLVSLLYWGIRAIDKSLVIPADMEIGPWADLGFHLAPAILLSVDLLLFSPPWTITAIPAMALSGVIAMVYWLWINETYSHNGFYPYPLFEQLNTAQRAVLFIVSALLMTGSTLLLKWLYGCVNGTGHGRPGRVKAS